MTPCHEKSHREAREQLAKGAAAADYKAYEREQEIRRIMNGELAACSQRMQVGRGEGWSQVVLELGRGLSRG